MAAFDASTVAASNTGVVSFSHTVTGAVPNRLLVLGASYRAHTNPTAHITAATYNGVAMLPVRRDQAVDRTTEIWYLVAPAAGTHTVALTWSADPEASVVGVSSYWGIFQPQPFSSDDGAIGNSNAMSVTMELRKITELFVEVVAAYPNSGANLVTPTSGGVNRYRTTSADLNIQGALSDSIGWRSPTSPVGFTSPQVFTWACSGVIFQGIEAESYLLLVDWDNDGLFSAAYDDISADALEASCSRGLDYDGSVFARSIAGTFKATLDNTSGKYSPFNSASPLAGKLTPGHFLRLFQLTPFFQALWSGEVDTIIPSASGPWPTAELRANGVLAGLKSKNISAPPQDNVNTGAVINAILDAAGWPASPSANLLLNPGFEAALGTIWNVIDTTMPVAATTAFDTVQKTEGTRSLKITGVGGNAGHTYITVYQTISPAGGIAPGQMLTLEFDRFIQSVGTGPWSFNFFCQAWDQVNYRVITLATQQLSVVDAGFVHVAMPLRALPYWIDRVFVIFEVSTETGSTGSGVMNIDNAKLYPTRFPPGASVNARNIATGAVTVGRWAVQEKPALTALQEMEETDTGYLFEGRSGEIIFEDRYARATNHPTSLINISDAPDAILSYLDIQEEDGIKHIYNSITAKVQPGHVGAAGTVLWTQTEVPITLAAGSFVEYEAVVADPNLYAATWITPVIAVDVIQTGVANTDILILAYKFAKTMRIMIRNVHATAAATLTLIQARGTPMVGDAVIGYTGEDTNSISTYGRRTFPLPSSWYRSSAFAQAGVDYFLTAFAQPQPAIRVALGPSLRMAQEAVTREISDRITLAALGPKTMLGLADDFYIDRIDYDIKPFQPIATTWTLSIASQTSSFWILGVNQLGVNTVLGW